MHLQTFEMGRFCFDTHDPALSRADERAGILRLDRSAGEARSHTIHPNTASDPVVIEVNLFAFRSLRKALVHAAEQHNGSDGGSYGEDHDVLGQKRAPVESAPHTRGLGDS